MQIHWSREHGEKVLSALILAAAYPGALLLFHPNALGSFPAAWQFWLVAQVIWAVAWLALVHHRTESFWPRLGWSLASFALILLPVWGKALIFHYSTTGAAILAAHGLLLAAYIGISTIKSFPALLRMPALTVLLAAVVFAQTISRAKSDPAFTRSPIEFVTEEAAIRQLIRVGLEHEGIPYQYGANLPETGRLDCSSLVQRVFRLVGVDVPRAAFDQFRDVSPDRVGKLGEFKPGDVVFFSGFRGPVEVGHVGIYLGGGRFLSALGDAAKVVIQPMNSPRWEKSFLGARRYRLPVIH